MARQMVVFGIGKELYGVDVKAVHEIIKVPEITSVPGAPDFLEGMINLRGRILPVIDLRRRMKLPATARNKATRVLITEHSGRVIGLVVDTVAEVHTYNHESLETPPELITAVGGDAIVGVMKVGDRLISLLDLRKVLTIEAQDKPARTENITPTAVFS